MRPLSLMCTAPVLVASLAAQTTWYVDPTGSDANAGTAAGPGSAFQTINFANSVAASGDVIRLAAATFGDEQGVVVLGDKNVILIGAGADQTVIQAHSTLTVNIDRGFPGSPVPTEQRPVVLVEGSAQVRFRGITFDGNFQVPPSGYLAGLVYRNGADGDVEDCVVRNCRANPLNASQGPVGIVVRGDNLADPCVVEVRDCGIHDFGKAGVVTFFNATLELSESYVRGAGHLGAGLPAQLGVQVSYDSTGLIRGTSFGDLYYSPATYAATAIVAYDTDNVLVIDDCHIGNCEQGIHCVQTQPGNTASAIIRENEIHGAETAIAIDTLNFAQVLDNKFHLRSGALGDTVWDNRAGHVWQGNTYGTYSGAGLHPIPGGGGNFDAAARNGVDLLAGGTINTVGPNAPVAVVTADVDGANGDDFVTADVGAAITVGINTGSSGFLTTTVSPGTPTATPVAIDAGEFNGLGGVDVALIAGDGLTLQSTVYVYRNNGVGSFALFSQFAVPGLGIPSDLATADLGNPSGDDLVVSGANGGVYLLQNNGGGSFTQTTLPGTYTRPIKAVVAGQFGGDGDTDLALLEGDATGGALHILIGDGAGGFTPRAPIATESNPQSIDASDLDGDLDDDLVAGFGSFGSLGVPATGSVTTFENLGDAAFRQSTSVADAPVRTVATGDLDRDELLGRKFGDAASIASGSTGVNVYGTFRSQVGFGDGGITGLISAPTGIDFGDFNGDGFQDLVCAEVTGNIVMILAEPQARIDHYGAGCAGTGERIPHLDVTGHPAPTQPNATFGFELSNARPFTFGLVLLSALPSSNPGPCLPQVNLLTLLDISAGLVSGAGSLTTSLPLPANPSVPGFALFAGGVVFDPFGQSFGLQTFSLTKGMRVRVGF